MEESEGYPKMEQLSKNYHLRSWLHRLIFDYCGAISALPESLFIDYGGTKYTRFPPKIAAAQKALF